MALLVHAYIGPSTIAGTGLFAAERITKGTRVWEFTPNFDQVFEDISTFHPLVVAHLKTYCYRYAGRYVLCADHAKFFNHSDNPSCYDDETYTYAARDIEAGEELTSDYRRFGMDSEDLDFNFLSLGLTPSSNEATSRHRQATDTGRRHHAPLERAPQAPSRGPWPASARSRPESCRPSGPAPQGRSRW